MRLIASVILLCISALPVMAGPDSARKLAEILRLGEAVTLIRDEGRAFGLSLDDEMLEGRGGALWQDRVGSIYATARIEDSVTTALQSNMTEAEIQQAISFFDTSDGHEILQLELSARKAMADSDIEDMMRARAMDASDPSVGQQRARDYARVNDLLGRNVAGTLAASVEFLRGMADGGALALDDMSIRAQVWQDRDSVAKDVESWLIGFLMLAYTPLSETQMQAYLEFCETDAGRALNDALFQGFDAAHLAISHKLGFAVAQALQSSTL